MAAEIKYCYVKLPKPTMDNVGKKITVYQLRNYVLRLYVEDNYSIKKMGSYSTEDISTSDDGSSGLTISTDNRKIELMVIDYDDDPQWYLIDVRDFDINFSNVISYS